MFTSGFRIKGLLIQCMQVSSEEQKQQNEKAAMK